MPPTLFFLSSRFQHFEAALFDCRLLPEAASFNCLFNPVGIFSLILTGAGSGSKQAVVESLDLGTEQLSLPFQKEKKKRESYSCSCFPLSAFAPNCNRTGGRGRRWNFHNPLERSMDHCAAGLSVLLKQGHRCQAQTALRAREKSSSCFHISFTEWITRGREESAFGLISTMNRQLHCH